MVGGQIPAQSPFGGFVPSDHDADSIHTRVLSHLHVRQAFVLRIASPIVHQLGGVQPYPENVVADLFLDRLDQFDHETAAFIERASIVVGAIVRERGQEGGQ